VEFLGLSFEFNDNDGLIISSTFDLEWPKFAILLNDWVIVLSSDKSLSIKDSVGWVFSSLVLCCITD